MQYYSFLFFGCLVGMQHALEADHLAAVAALSRNRNSRRAMVLRGGAWGVGHTVTLFCVCSMLWLLEETISPYAEALLELVVGAMIIMLGSNVLYALWRRRPHIHVHGHARGVRHLHVHSHAEDEVRHSDSAHDHDHAHRGLRRAALVGMVHGAAGSAGLVILATAAQSVAQAAGFILAFGAGSIIGMAALSFVASYPLLWLERAANWVNTAVFASIGGAAIFVGGLLMQRSWGVL